MRKLFVFSLAVLIMASGAEAAVFNVTNVTEFQNALTIAQSNGEDDTINLAAGTYYFAVLTYFPSDPENYALTIVGAGAGNTILDGGDLTRILLVSSYSIPVDSSAHITIRGITFQNGRGGDGGGLYVMVMSANITVEDSEFNSNSGSSGGGADLFSQQATLTLTNNTFSYNSSSIRGGGAHVFGRTIDLTDNIFSHNSVDGNGGGIYVDRAWETITLTNNTFSDNSSSSSGGGAYIYPQGDEITAINNTFTDNSSGGWGGGVLAMIDPGTITFTNNTFSDNSGNLGGGFYISPGRGTASVANNTFTDNSADLGGGTYISGHTGTTTLTNNIFNRNTAADYGGGAYAYLLQLGSVNLTNNTFNDNSTVGDGGGLYVYLWENTNTFNIYNNIIWGNSAMGVAGDLYVHDDGDDDGLGADVNLYNNDYSVFDIYDGDSLHYGDNIDQDPLLSAAFHLQVDSPCIDTGKNDAAGLPDYDFEGDLRILDGNDDGTAVVDMGADEALILYFDLTIETSTGGTTDPSPEVYSYPEGTEISIEAIPEDEYRFSGWSGDASGTDSPVTITIDADKSITANFIRQYTLTIAAGTGGTTDPEPRAYTYDDGTEVSITAVPDSGYEFTGWGGDASGTTNPITITMNSDKSITANFRSIPEEEEREEEKKGSCFIATATYGSPLHPYVEVLRELRDEYLMPNKLGRSLVGLYYKYSPFVADLISKHKALKVAVHINLLPMIAFSYLMVNFGPIITVFTCVFIFVLPIFLIFFYRRKLKRVKAKAT